MFSTWEGALASLRRIGFDTNALIYLLENREPYASHVMQAMDIVDRGLAIGFVSTVVEMEMLVKPLRDGNANALDRADTFFRQRPNLHISPMDRVVARKAAEIRARTRLAPLDSIIIATAIGDRCDAIIGNDYAVASRMTGIPYICLDDYV